MAILGKGILDGFRGKLDGLTGQKRNGHSTISQYREGSDINWSLQTDAERTKMSYLRGVYGSFSSAQLNQFFNIRSPRNSKFFEFVKRNYSHASIGTFMPPSDFDGDSFLGMPVPNLTTTKVIAGVGVQYRWFATPLQPNWQSTDRMRCMVWAPTLNRFVSIATGSLRSTGSSNGPSNTLPVGTLVYVMMSIRSLDNKHTSRWIIFPRTVVAS